MIRRSLFIEYILDIAIFISSVVLPMTSIIGINAFHKRWQIRRIGIENKLAEIALRGPWISNH